jgi:hypothetical protein
MSALNLADALNNLRADNTIECQCGSESATGSLSAHVGKNVISMAAPAATVAYGLKTPGL